VANLQPLNAMVVISWQAPPAYQHKQAAIAEATADSRKLAQPLPHGIFIRSVATVAN
jgi:hypothetical protein